MFQIRLLKFIYKKDVSAARTKIDKNFYTDELIHFTASLFFTKKMNAVIFYLLFDILSFHTFSLM